MAPSNPALKMAPTNVPPPLPPILQQRPVNAHQIRFNKDVKMQGPRALLRPISAPNQIRTGPREAPPHITPPVLPERPCTTPCQSAVSLHTDTGKVVQGILDLEISLPLRELLGNSKEINQGLQNEIKLKNKASNLSANQIMVSQSKA